VLFSKSLTCRNQGWMYVVIDQEDLFVYKCSHWSRRFTYRFLIEGQSFYIFAFTNDLRIPQFNFFKRLKKPHFGANDVPIFSLVSAQRYINDVTCVTLNHVRVHSDTLYIYIYIYRNIMSHYNYNIILYYNLKITQLN
jgi:hypothetical protein